jgi:hypothetical protein
MQLDFGLAKRLDGLAPGSGEAIESWPTGAGQLAGMPAGDDGGVAERDSGGDAPDLASLSRGCR